MNVGHVRAAMLFAAALSIVGVWPEAAEAQGRRAVRRPPARPVVVVGAYYRPLYYDPFFYDPWFRGYGVYSGYGWYPRYGYARAYDEAAVRVQVDQREAEVFVDGYYAGRVDDFDGVFQRLRVEPGEHELQVYLAGHRPVSQRVYLQPSGSFTLRGTLEPLAPGDAEPQRPQAVERPAARQGAVRERDPRVPPGREPRPPASPGARTEFGALIFRVQPADAEVFIDGERWQGPGTDEELVVQVAPGRHRVEVRKDGFGPFTGEIDVAAGDTAPLNISLPRQ